VARLQNLYLSYVADRWIHRLAVAKGCSDFKPPIYVTDQIPMLELMRQNIQKNGCSALVEAHVYDWGQPASAELPTHPDIVLAADCVYFEPAFALLHQTLLDLIGPETVCYFCFKRRRRADLQFIKTIKKTFEVRHIDDDSDKASYTKDNIFLYVVALPDGLSDRSSGFTFNGRVDKHAIKQWDSVSIRQTVEFAQPGTDGDSRRL